MTPKKEKTPKTSKTKNSNSKYFAQNHKRLDCELVFATFYSLSLSFTLMLHFYY